LLVRSGTLTRKKDGVRLLGKGELKSKVAIEVAGASAAARAAVEKAGGSVVIAAPREAGGEAEARTGKKKPASAKASPSRPAAAGETTESESE